MMFVVVFVVIVIAVGIYLKMKWKHSYWKRKGIKYAEPSFFAGNFNLVDNGRHMSQIVDDFYKNFNKERYFGLYQFLEPVVLIKEPNLIKQVTIKEFDSFIDHTTFARPKADPLWSESVLVTIGAKWRSLRSTLSPSFTANKMKIMFELIEQCSQQFTNYLQDQLEGNGKILELDVKEACSRFTNDVIASTSFGIKCNSLQDQNTDFFKMGQKLTDTKGFNRLKFFLLAINPTITDFFGARIISKSVSEYFTKIIHDNVNTRKEKNIIRPDMIHLLMQGENLTNDEIASQAMIFFSAGFDTVSTCLSFILYELALNPDCQERLREEITSTSDQLTYDTIANLKYLDMVVSETLRLWPPFPFTDRKVTKDFTLQPEQPGEKPLLLEKNTAIWLPIYSIQRDPEFYPEPEKFNPERFNDENKHKINPSTYLVFGSGPRNCIGMRLALLESKVLIAHIIKKFQVVPVKRTNIPMILDSTELNTASKGGMWLGFKKIQT